MRLKLKPTHLKGDIFRLETPTRIIYLTERNGKVLISAQGEIWMDISKLIDENGA